MQVTVRFELPRDAMSIPVLRKLCGQSLGVIGAEQEVIDDVELALTEACANVLHHVGSGAHFEVVVGFDEQRAFLDVIDHGPGFDPDRLPAADPDPEAEGGRGVQLMRELMDLVQFDSVTGSGTTVHLEKQLRWRPEAPIHRLAPQGSSSD